MSQTQKASAMSLTRAWLVHIFTMTGVIWGVLAMIAVLEGDAKLAFLWLFIALVVDGLDGTLARWAKVREVVPWFDGTVLDLIVDYLTYTFIPAVFIYNFLPMPGYWAAITAVVLICASSMFCFCNTKMKSTDFYFVGFPAVWNIAAFYYYVLDLGPWFNFLMTIVLSILTLTTIKFVHPFRVRYLMPVNIVAAVTWLATSVWQVVAFPSPPLALTIFWWASGLWIVGIGLWRTWQARD